MFLKMLSYDAQYSSKSNKFCEIIDPRRFRMFIDCDIQTDATVEFFAHSHVDPSIMRPDRCSTSTRTYH